MSANNVNSVPYRELVDAAARKSPPAAQKMSMQTKKEAGKVQKLCTAIFCCPCNFVVECCKGLNGICVLAGTGSFGGDSDDDSGYESPV